MKADLHVHSKFSKRPSQWILQKINCPESFTEPLQIYRLARDRGMSLVTITDHNTIAGALEIAHLADTFVSEEITTYFPEDGCKIHVLALNITEQEHQDIQKVRENIFDLTTYLQQQKIVHVLAHPLYSVNDRLTADHFEKLLLLFKNFELNGAREEAQNVCLQGILAGLTLADIDRLSDKHQIEPAFPEPWRKNLTGGSDDHSSLNIARRYTEAPNTSNLSEFLRAIGEQQTVVHGKPASPLTLAHNLYGIAYQFYKHKLNLDRHLPRDIFLRFLDRLLQVGQEQDEGVLAKLYSIWNFRRRSRRSAKTSISVQQLLQLESQELIWNDPELMAMVRSSNGHKQDLEQKWFEFVDTVSNKVLHHFGDHMLDHLSGANFFNIFQSLGSAGALYSLIAPYFLSFSLFTKDRHLVNKIGQHFPHMAAGNQRQVHKAHVAHFTDTFYEVNGVALTLRQQVQTAVKTGKKLTVITCDADNHAKIPGVHNFLPIGVYALPVYQEQKLFYPPFLGMLNFCYEKQFTSIHSATPGPIGLAALAIARILKLPISGTYHTALPQYAKYLTGDNNIEDLMWNYMVWYYDQMDTIFAPSESTARELAQKGVNPEKIKLFPRGIDIERFQPGKKSDLVNVKYGLNGHVKLLYVGRVSKEKDLQLLAQVFKSLVLSVRDVSLIVVGDGPYLQEMQEELKDMPVTFTGYLQGEELAATYASCDLFVFPSTTDTFGNVVLEAQASGLPVIVTDCGGPQENILPGKTGVVVPGKDQKEMLKAIRELVTDSDKRQAMGREGRIYMEARSFEQAFERTWRIYEGNSEGGQKLAHAV